MKISELTLKARNYYMGLDKVLCVENGMVCQRPKTRVQKVVIDGEYVAYLRCDKHSYF
jgi:hypothetical protein